MHRSNSCQSTPKHSSSSFKSESIDSLLRERIGLNNKMKKHLDTTNLLILSLIDENQKLSTENNLLKKENITLKASQLPLKNSENIDELLENIKKNTKKLIGELKTKIEKKDDEMKQTEECFYITKTGTKYHLDSCRWLRKSRILASKSQIRNLQPCKTCFNLRKSNKK